MVEERHLDVIKNFGPMEKLNGLNCFSRNPSNNPAENTLRMAPPSTMSAEMGDTDCDKFMTTELIDKNRFTAIVTRYADIDTRRVVMFKRK